MVSREQAADARYGLGKSLRLLMQALADSGTRTRHLNFQDADPARLQQARERGSTLARWLDDLWGGFNDHGLLGQFCACLELGVQAAQQARQPALGISHIHVHDAAIAFGLLLASAGRGNRPRWGLTQHSFDCMTEAIHQYVCPLPAALRHLLLRLERRVLQRAHWVIFLSEASRQHSARQLGLPAPPAHWRVIPHPLPSLHLPERSAARHSLGWHLEETVVLSVGQLIPLKGHDLLLAACARLQADTRLRVVLLGDGHLEATRQQAHALGLYCDMGPVADVSPYLAAADVYVSSSRTESYGLANVEAALAGLPMVCTAVGAVPEVLAGSGAHLVNPDVAGITHGLRAALAESPTATACQRQAWQARQWAMPAVAQATLAAYRHTPTS